MGFFETPSLSLSNQTVPGNVDYFRRDVFDNIRARLDHFSVTVFDPKSVAVYVDSSTPNGPVELLVGLRRRPKKSGKFENLKFRRKEDYVATERPPPNR